MMKRLLILGAVLVALGATARADDPQFYATYNLAYNGNQTDNGQVAGLFTVVEQPSGPTFTAFCVDLKDSVTSGVTYNGNLSYGQVSNNTASFNAPASQNPGLQVSYLVGTIWQGASLTNDQVLALQGALWHVASGGGNFTPSTTDGQKIYNDLLTLLGGHQLTANDLYLSALTTSTAAFNSGGTYNSSGIVLITPNANPYYNGWNNFQEYQTLVSYSISTPEPSSMAIAGLGALGFLAYGLRRRKVS